VSTPLFLARIKPSVEKEVITLTATREIGLTSEELILLTQDGDLPCQLEKCLQSLSVLPHIPVGSFLGPEKTCALFQVVMKTWVPKTSNPVSRGYWLRALRPITLGDKDQSLHLWQEGRTVAWITLSDKGSQGKRRDESGPIIPKVVQQVIPLSMHQGFLIPDETKDLKAVLSNLAFEQQFDLICTTGGTGVTSRDITPETSVSLFDRRLTGFEQAMLSSSLSQTPHGMISRAAVGIISKSLVINLPGSPKAVRENLSAILPALKHTLDKIHDDPGECAPTLS
jgi:molybdenum cofactor synthesis domain-containing protein